MSNSDKAGSYHLEVAGPKGTFLARQRVINAFNAQEADLRTNRYAMQKRLGQRHSHLYIHGGGHFFADEYFENYFLERVPGSVGFATMSALGAAVLIFVSAASRLGLSAGGTSDLIVALLAFPAVAGTWMGFDDQSSLIGGSLVSRLSNIVTIVVSLLAATVFLLLPGAEAKDTAAIVDRPWAWVWILLVGASLINVIGDVASWTLRAIVQRDLISREV